MSEAGPEVPPTPASRPDWRDRHGATLRAILVGCGSVCLGLLLVASLSIYVLSRDPRNRRLAEGVLLNNLEKQVSTDGRIPAPDRKELDAAYGRFQKDWSDERIHEADGDRARHALLELSDRDRITPLDIRNLTRLFDSFVRGAPPARR